MAITYTALNFSESATGPPDFTKGSCDFRAGCVPLHWQRDWDTSSLMLAVFLIQVTSKPYEISPRLGYVICVRTPIPFFFRSDEYLEASINRPPMMSTPESENQRPLTFFDITIGNSPAGRVVFSLFTDLVPKTADNFRRSPKF